MRNAMIATLTTVCVGATLALALPQVSHARSGQFPLGQGGAGQGGRHGERLKKLTEELGLTDAQKALIRPILKSAREQAKAVRQDTSLSPADRKAKVKDIRQTTRARVMAVLTPVQKQKMAEMRHHGPKRDGAATG